MEAKRNDVCWYCGGRLIWNSDFDYADVYNDGKDGIVTYLHCSECGARVTYESVEDSEHRDI